MGKRYDKITQDESGWSEWIQPDMTTYKMMCCDCSLVHRMEFRVHEARIQFRAGRHDRATAAARAARRKKGR